ncbi:MAG TPA: hypothetical protein DCS43_10840, partial [Verrucomicrobia bacterium]|nr:hypothetical protein [Verrucomicrobiota bacterium]
GDTLQTAETVAAGNLARIFRTDIVVDERLTERYYELIGKQNVYQEQSQLDRNISVYTAMSLQNVQYPERYTDKKTGRVYALATLNRAETAAIYVNRLKENDAMIVRFVQRSESPSPAMTYAALAAAVAISADSHQLRAQLDVLYPQAKSQVSTTYAHDVLQQRMATAAKQIGVAVSIENDPDGKVAQTIIAQLTGLGFVVAPGDAFLQVRGSVAMEETDLGSKGTFFVRYVMKLDMVDAYGKTVAALSEQGREGHISLNEAANRCTRSMTGAVERQLVNKVFNYFDRLLM